MTRNIHIPRTGKLLAFLLVALPITPNVVMACAISTSWTQNGSGTVERPRYQDQCAYQAAALNDTLSHNLSDISTYTVAFYALTRFSDGGTASHTVTVFRASDDGIPQLELTVKGDETANLAVTGSTTLTGAINTLAANYNGWNHFKVVWDGSIVSFFINGVKTAGTASLTGTLDLQQIGHIASTTPNLVSPLAFDHFISLLVDESAQTKPLCPGDIDASGGRDFIDVFSVYDEFASAGANLTMGQPDFNGDGSIDFVDVFGIYGVFAGAAGSCP